MTAPAPSWLSVFNGDDRAFFFAEMAGALQTSAARGDPEPLETCLREWKVTAQAMADPQAREVLTGPLRDEDFTGAIRPGAHN